MADLSRESLLRFLEYLGAKGLINQTTAGAKRAAVGRVLAILDDQEASDVSSLDVDGVMARFTNLEGTKYTPDSLATYRSRLKSSIEDFVRYQRDPINFRPASSQTVKRAADRDGSTVEARTKRSPLSRDLVAQEPPPSSVSILPIPIRPDLTIKIQGLPYDLTAAEAMKIANVVRAMAVAE